MKKVFAVAIVCCLLFVWKSFAQAPQYEFRAAWVATVDNIDWPSKSNLTPEKQREEFISQLDMHQRNGLNAVVVQIRPSTDAFYPSQYEPWSHWLTGKQGKAPDPYYDPLAFMIEETHKRGMEFHAWCNPYRAEFAIGKYFIANDHITKQHPDWFLSYGTTRYFDPGNKEVQQYVVKVIRDIVSRYDVDAVHFDDYFYPYRIAGKEFPDDVTYRKYGNGMSRDAWRRSNVDSIIVHLSTAIKEEKMFCQFGISPFGVWRNADKDPEGSATTAGQTNYDDLYADILLWLKKGWIDYVTPQLYWEFGHKAAPYEVLLDWWAKHTYGRNCYIGLGIYRANSNTIWKNKNLLPRQVAALRQYPEIQGAVYFSSTSFVHNPLGWSDSLRLNYYRLPAHTPPLPWLDSLRPMSPVIKSARVIDSVMQIVTVKAATERKKIKGFRLYACYDDVLRFNNFYTASWIGTKFESDTCVFAAPLLPDKKFARFFITTIDENDIESKPYINWPVKIEAVRNGREWRLNP